MIFTIILTLIALAALYQFAKFIWFTVLWLATKLLLFTFGVMMLAAATLAPPPPPPDATALGRTNVVPFKRKRA